MIISKLVKIKISKKIYPLLVSKGYTLLIGEIHEIKTEDLPKGSHTKIEVECDICHKKKFLMYQKYIKNISNQNIYSCSSKCSQIKVRETSMRKFGNAHYTRTQEYTDSISKTNIKKYGVDHHFKSEIVRDKIKRTNLEKYGFDNPFQSKEIKDKIKKTNLEKYGFDNPSFNLDVKNKIRLSFKERWDSQCKVSHKEIDIRSYKNKTYEASCDLGKGHFFSISNTLLNNRKVLKCTICTICHPIGSGSSSQEMEVCEFVRSIYNKEIVTKDRKLISPLELDILLPDIKVALEFNGLE